MRCNNVNNLKVEKGFFWRVPVRGNLKECVRQIVNRLGYDITRIREVAVANKPIGAFDEMMKKKQSKESSLCMWF